MDFNDDDYSDETHRMFEQLLKTGSLVIIGLDDNGEPVYQVTEKCKELYPDFYNLHQMSVNQTTFDLWSLGVVDVQFFDDDTSVSFKRHNLEKFFEVEDTLTEEQISIVDTFMSKTMRESARKFM